MKQIVIIGGSSGIGQELVQVLAREGHQVYATYFQHPAQKQTEGVQYFPLNVQAETVDLSFLPDTIDGLAYCPGSIQVLPFGRLKTDDVAQDFDLQVVGAIKVLQGCLAKLKASKNASVVFFSTVAVQTGFPFHAQVAASKGALEGLTRSLAAELAPIIRVNAVAPSITATPLAAKFLNTEEKLAANAQKHPLKRIGTAADIAEMAAFLLSEKSSWMTGQVLHVDGGISSIKN